jgi:hypothetical protein
MMINFIEFGCVCVGCSWRKELMLQLNKILHRIGIQFSHKLFFLKFCSFWFYFGGLSCILVSFIL